jgi:hypothetical protein
MNEKEKEKGKEKVIKINENLNEIKKKVDHIHTFLFPNYKDKSNYDNNNVKGTKKEMITKQGKEENGDFYRNKLIQLLDLLQNELSDPISKEPLKNPIVTDCGHIFGLKCLQNWFKFGNKTCPLCREIILSMDKKSCSSIENLIKGIKPFKTLITSTDPNSKLDSKPDLKPTVPKLQCKPQLQDVNTNGNDNVNTNVNLKKRKLNHEMDEPVKKKEIKYSYDKLNYNILEKQLNELINSDLNKIIDLISEQLIDNVKLKKKIFFEVRISKQLFARYKTNLKLGDFELINTIDKDNYKMVEMLNPLLNKEIFKKLKCLLEKQGLNDIKLKINEFNEEKFISYLYVGNKK